MNANSGEPPGEDDKRKKEMVNHMCIALKRLLTLVTQHHKLNPKE